MTIQRLPLTIAAGTMAAMMLTISTHAADGGSGTAELTLRMTPLGRLSAGYQTAYKEIPFSPDRHRAAVIATQGSRQTVMVDGQAGPLFSKIVTPTMSSQRAWVTFSPDSESFTYVGDPDGKQQVVVTDGKQGAGYTQIRWLQYSPVGHRLAYVGEIKDDEDPSGKNSKVVVVVDGKPGPAFNHLQASGQSSGFQFSPDGNRFAYIALAQIKVGQFNQTRNSYHVVVDGEPSPGYGGIGGLRFSPNGQSVAYTVQVGGIADDTRAVINGQVGPAYRQILPLEQGRAYTALDAIKFSEDGQHFAYVAAKSPEPKGGITAYVLVVDGEEVAQEAAPDTSYTSIEQATLSPDGKRWAYAAVESAGRGQPSNVFVTVNGQRSSNYTNCTAIVFSPDSRHVAAIVTNANRKEFLIFDGGESEAYGSVALESLQFSPDSNRYAYLAQRDRDFVVVVDGLPGPAHPYIDPKSLRFSDDGRHFSYAVAAHSTYQQLTVVDHEVRGIKGVSSSDGTKSVHVTVEGAGGGSQKSTLMVDGQPYGSTFHHVDQLQLSPDGSRVAAIGVYSGTSGVKLTHLLIDGYEGPASFPIEHLVFTPDSKHVVSVAETDNRVGQANYPSHQLSVDGQAIAEFDRIDIQSTFDPQTNQNSVEAGLGFLPDGTLEFYAVRDEMLYRVLLDSSGLDGLPSLEDSTAASPGPRVILDIGSNPQGPGDPHNLAIAPDGRLFATASRGGKYKQGFLFRLDAAGSDMQVLYDFLGNQSDGSKPTALLYGPDDTLYGLLSTGGQNGLGSIFRIGSDGSGFAAIHHFESNSTSPALVSVGADGSLDGTLVKNKQTQAFRVDTKSNEYSIIYETASASDRRDLENQRVDFEQQIESYKQMQEQMRPYVNQGPDRGQAAAKQAMETYAKNIETAEAELAKVDAQLAGGPTEPIGPMIDGGDGFFYGTTLEGIFKLEKSSLEFTRLHTFAGPPLDGQWARTPPMITRDGTLYGLTSAGGIAKGGIIYRISHDGSGYRVAYNPDTRLSSIGNPFEGPDGTIFTVLSSQGPNGLYRVGENDTELDLVDPLGSYIRAENLQFVGQDLYGVVQWGNGRGQIFRYVLPTAGSGSGAVVSVNESIESPGPIIVPNDSQDPAQYLFADITLPAPVTPSSTPKKDSGIVKTTTPQVNQPVPEEPAKEENKDDPVSDGTEIVEKAKETDKPPSKMEKTTDQVEETAKKAKKLFKSFGF